MIHFLKQNNLSQHFEYRNFRNNFLKTPNLKFKRTDKSVSKRNKSVQNHLSAVLFFQPSETIKKT